MEKENDDTIKVNEFVYGRLKDIEYIQSAIAKDRKKTMLYQRLKYYQRRRSRSGTRKKINNRRRERFVSRTHVWYAKRFKMIKINNWTFPYKRNLKTSKFIYKSLNRGFIFEEFYKITKVFEVREDNKLCKIALKGKFSTIKIQDKHLEVALIDNYLIVSYVKNDVDESIFNDLKLVHIFYCSFLVLLPTTTFEFNNTLAQLDKPFYVPFENNGGKILCSNNQSMNVLLSCINKSLIPVSIIELQRIALENKILLYPLDHVQSTFYEDFENAVNKELIDKYERIPLGKKVVLDVNEMFIATDYKDLQYVYLDLKEGSIDKNAYIYQNNEVVGRVIRGGFAFSIGRCRCLGYLNTYVNKNDQLYVRNLKNNRLHEICGIEIVKVG